MNNQAIQHKDLAFRTKLTAVNVYLSPSRRFTAFLMLFHDRNGRAVLPISTLDKILAGVPRGTTITVG